jgi:hypothetical protein
MGTFMTAYPAEGCSPELKVHLGRCVRSAGGQVLKGSFQAVIREQLPGGMYGKTLWETSGVIADAKSLFPAVEAGCRIAGFVPHDVRYYDGRGNAGFDAQFTGEHMARAVLQHWATA